MRYLYSDMKRELRSRAKRKIKIIYTTGSKSSRVRTP